MGSAVAGETKVFAATVSDVCGYPGYAPPADLALTSQISFAGYLDTSVAAECGHIAVTTPAALPVTSTFSGDGEPCGRFGDVYMFSYTPSHAGDGQLKITSGASTFVDSTIAIAPGAISAKESAVSGHLTAAEAGVPTTIVVEPKDAFGNPMVGTKDYSSSFQYSATDLNGQAYAAKVSVEKEAGQTYKFTVTYPSAGSYYLALYVDEAIMEGFPTVINVAKPALREAITYGNKPVTRFEHSMESRPSNGDLYVFGGATHQGSYAGDTWKWKSTNADDDWKYRRTIKVTGKTTDYIVEFDLDTHGMIQDGKLKPDCSDVLFHSKEGSELQYFMAPSGVSGCGTTSTTIYVSLTSAQDEFYMYYGNHKKSSTPSTSMFEYFEDFEGDTLPETFTLETDTCATAGDISGFTTSSDVSVTGSKSLKVDAENTIGGSIKTVTSNLTKFRLKYYFFDTLCEGIHFLSPDFEACTALGGSKVESSAGSAIGVYSSSNPSKYAYSSPWKAGASSRKFGFNEFYLVDDDTNLKMYVDGQLTAETAATDLDKIFIRGTTAAGSSKGSVGYYDTIIATSYDPAVSVQMGGEDAVSYSPDAGWESVGLSSPPPKRQAHASVVYGDSMYIFGGERSAYFYSDLWKYDFAADAWSFIPVKNMSSSLGRYDHSAVVHEDCMYIYGGRSPDPQGDFWKYDFKLQTWNVMPTSEGMGPRFGHVAVVSGDKMYIYGGYLHDSEKLTTELWSFDFKSSKWTLVGPRRTNFGESYVMDPSDAISFPSVLPPERHSGVGVAFGSHIVVVGGAGGADMGTELGDAYVFDAEKKAWTALILPSDNEAGLQRYDSAGASFGTDKIALFGGHGKGEFHNNLYNYHVDL